MNGGWLEDGLLDAWLMNLGMDDAWIMTNKECIEDGGRMNAWIMDQ